MEQKLPFFSIIVPTRKRPELLVACLQAMARLEYPRDLFEIVVVVDGGKVPSGEQLASLQTMIDLTILTQSHAGPAAARNNGARDAKGEYFVFTDDDCMPMPDWLSKLAEGFLMNPDCAIGGRTVNALPNNRYSAASQFLMDFLYADYTTAPADARFFASNNIAVPAALFRTIGGFSESFTRAAGEDRDFCLKLRMHGHCLVYVQEAVIRHAHDLTFAGFLIQQFNYGRGSFLYHNMDKARNRRRPGFEPLSFYVRLLIYPFFHVAGVKKITLSFMFLLSQVAVAAGYFRAMAAYGGNGSSKR